MLRLALDLKLLFLCNLHATQDFSLLSGFLFESSLLDELQLGNTLSLKTKLFLSFELKLNLPLLLSESGSLKYLGLSSTFLLETHLLLPLKF
jgi:hypothetical protein